jgi:hypothetical protein
MQAVTAQHADRHRMQAQVSDVCIRSSINKRTTAHLAASLVACCIVIIIAI